MLVVVIKQVFVVLMIIRVLRCEVSLLSLYL